MHYAPRMDAVKPRPYFVNSETTRSAAMASIGMLNVTDKQWDITIEPHRMKKTASQNRLMWLWLEKVVQLIHEDTGQSKTTVHEYFKQQFLEPEVGEINGVIVKTWSTKPLERADMSKYLDKIYAHVVSEWGLLLPVPEDLGRAA